MEENKATNADTMSEPQQQDTEEAGLEATTETNINDEGTVFTLKLTAAKGRRISPMLVLAGLNEVASIVLGHMTQTTTKRTHVEIG